MRPALASLLLLTGCGAANTRAPQIEARAAAPVAPVMPQVWRGRLHCAPMPGYLPTYQNEPIEVTVTGNVARYDRIILPARAGGDIHEQGGGTVAADGSLTLTGQAAGTPYSYSAQYSGMLQPDGDMSRLSGKQLWRVQRAKAAGRFCSMTLRRDG